MLSKEQENRIEQEIREISTKSCNIAMADFKDYMLGLLFYTYLSEDFIQFMESQGISQYDRLENSVLTPEIKRVAVLKKGYWIEPRKLFENVLQDIVTDAQRDRAFDYVQSVCASLEETSTSPVFNEIFKDMRFIELRFGGTAEVRNKNMIQLMQGLAEFNPNKYTPYKKEALRVAFESVLERYASYAGKDGAKLTTPKNLAKLMARVATNTLKNAKNVYDSASLSGELVIQTKALLADETPIFVQKLEHYQFGILRMRLLINGIPFQQINVSQGDIFEQPQFKDKSFDLIVSNPPYAQRWREQNDMFSFDPRFETFNVLPPKHQADWAFVLHNLHSLSSQGKAVMLCYPGAMYREGAEKQIREQLVVLNYVETVIVLPSNLMSGSTVEMVILVLAKNKLTTNIQFIDATGSRYTQDNLLTDTGIEDIIQLLNNDTSNSVFVTQEQVLQNDAILSVKEYTK